MKKSILLLSAVFLAVQFSLAQEPDQAVALVRYTFSHIRDTSNRATIYTENMELLLGKNASVYRSADKRLQDEQMKKQIADQVNAGATGNITINAVSKTRASNTEYYQFQAEKKLFRKEKIINNYLVEESWPSINWKITADTASFGSLHCQKATTSFRGRNYEAWFCPALPFRSGPWKLNGLPGLIVEASDSKKEVIFKFTGLQDASKIAASNTTPVADLGNASRKVTKIIGLGDDDGSLFKTIALPQNGIKTSEKEFAQLKEAMRKDPQGFINTAFAGLGSGNRITSTTMTPPANPVKNAINNPIELNGKP